MSKIWVFISFFFNFASTWNEMKICLQLTSLLVLHHRRGGKTSFRTITGRFAECVLPYLRAHLTLMPVIARTFFNHVESESKDKNDTWKKNDELRDTYEKNHRQKSNKFTHLLQWSPTVVGNELIKKKNSGIESRVTSCSVNVTICHFFLHQIGHTCQFRFVSNTLRKFASKERN